MSLVAAGRPSRPAAGATDAPSPCPCVRHRDAVNSAPIAGILVLQYLRGRGIGLSALLFADLDDREQAAYLERALAPLFIVDSREGLAQLTVRLRQLAAGGARDRRAPSPG
jgi:hypothetical protein